MTEAMFHMHMTVITTNICPFSYVHYIIQTERFDNMIDIVRIAKQIKITLTPVYNIAFFSIEWLYFKRIMLQLLKFVSRFDFRNEIHFVYDLNSGGTRS